MTESVTGFYEQYKRLMGLLLSHGITDHNERTGHDILVLRGGYSFVIDLEGGVIPVPGTRKVFPKSAAAEVAWWTQGTQSVKFINHYAKSLWSKFVEDDGDTVAAAYGYRWKNHFGRDQLELAVDQLYREPSDRQIIVCAWDPAGDALGSPAKKNVPCPLLFHLTSLPLGGRRREVCMHVLKRSTDCFVGLPYDVLGYALLQQAIVTELNDRRFDETNSAAINRWTLGTLTFNLDHPHLYDSHFIDTRDMLREEYDFIEPPMPKTWSLSNIETNPHGYVEAVGDIQSLMKQPGFHSRPEVIE